MNWLKWIKSLFQHDRPESQHTDGFAPRDLSMLANALEKTRQREISCDEVYQLLDQVAELADQGADISTLMPLVQHHLDMCHDCREEYQALLNVLQAVTD
jgi:hemerythrin-like domain-containing protein